MSGSIVVHISFVLHIPGLLELLRFWIWTLSWVREILGTKNQNISVLFQRGRLCILDLSSFSVAISSPFVDSGASVAYFIIFNTLWWLFLGWNGMLARSYSEVFGIFENAATQREGSNLMEGTGRRILPRKTLQPSTTTLRELWQLFSIVSFVSLFGIFIMYWLI